MQIVIDIPESILNTIQADEMISREQLAVLQMHILNGTPLPKGHGRLIDADALLDTDRLIVDSMKCHYIPMMDIYNAPTIIEADRAESEDKE